jgi:EAL domain-containing protein (putative c-di-GMP-specific phosphodiesterase class I)
MLQRDIHTTISKLNELKKLGVRFSLDDFGTGYSSLSYLKKLPLDFLKIDRSFVRDIMIDQEDAAIAETILLLAQTLGMKVIAEGVETLDQYHFLKTRGCDYFQGYLFGKPAPLDD